MSTCALIVENTIHWKPFWHKTSTSEIWWEWRTIHSNRPPLLLPPIRWLIPSIPRWTRCMVFLMVPPLTGGVKEAAVRRPSDGEGIWRTELGRSTLAGHKSGTICSLDDLQFYFLGTDRLKIYLYTRSVLHSREWVTVRKWHKWVGVKPAGALVVIRAADRECTCRRVFLKLAPEWRLSGKGSKAEKVHVIFLQTNEIK